MDEDQRKALWWIYAAKKCGSDLPDKEMVELACTIVVFEKEMNKTKHLKLPFQARDYTNA